MDSESEHNNYSDGDDGNDENFEPNGHTNGQASRKRDHVSYNEGSEDEEFEPSPKKKKKKKDKDSTAKKEKKKHKKEKKDKLKVKIEVSEKKSKSPSKHKHASIKNEAKSPKASPKKKAKKEEPERWKWWEEDTKNPLPDGHKWRFMQHKGPIFAPSYDPLPKGVNFYYDGDKMKLSEPAEEVMGFYARMIEHEYTTKEAFNKNFFADWRNEMNHEEMKTITKLSKCDFKEVCEYYKQVSQQRKERTKEEKLQEKETKEALMAEYGFCVWDGHKEKIGNFNIEPPGLFRGRGEHPKMGKFKKRVTANDIIINCSKDSDFPEAPEGYRWKKVQHDPTVTWLASWTENVQGQNKYIMLNANSRIKGEKDLAKYEKARKLHKIIDKVRGGYREDWKSKEMAVRQRAVAMYFIDRLALRAGNEKDAEEEADTVGCCNLRCEHITLKPKGYINGVEKEYIIEFDFLGKDSMQYHNEVDVEKRVYKNVNLFMENKEPEDDLFDRVDTSKLNTHLNSIMDGLTAKVFRTYNASITLQRQLKKLTDTDQNLAEKVLSYNRANRDVAILCNHQRAAPKTFDAQMGRMDEKIDAKVKIIKEKKKEIKNLKKESKNEKNTKLLQQKKKQLQRLEEQHHKLQIDKTDKDENKTIALGTSKLNYLDPRISVAWCKKHDVPVEKVYNKTQRDKFAWAIDMVMLTDEEYIF